MDWPVAWRCQPTNRVPSYATVSFSVRMTLRQLNGEDREC